MKVTRSNLIHIPVSREWHETAHGGLIMHTGPSDWLARPANTVGMNAVLHFNEPYPALDYANSKPL